MLVVATCRHCCFPLLIVVLLFLPRFEIAMRRFFQWRSSSLLTDPRRTHSRYSTVTVGSSLSLFFRWRAKIRCREPTLVALFRFFQRPSSASCNPIVRWSYLTCRADVFLLQKNRLVALMCFCFKRIALLDYFISVPLTKRQPYNHSWDPISFWFFWFNHNKSVSMLSSTFKKRITDFLQVFFFFSS